MDTKSKFALGLFFVSSAYLLSQSKDDEDSQIEGINIDADKLINSVGNKLIKNPKLRNGAKNLAHKAITEFIGASK